MDIAEAFRAGGSTLAFVGAGGKKTTMYALADRLDRAVVTATVRIPIFDPHVATVAVTADPVERLLDAAPAEFPLGLVPAQERDDRYMGYEPSVVDAISDGHAGPVLIKADGARMRDFKAPKGTEPKIPRGVDVVVPIASASVVGEPLSGEAELVHRPERVVSVARAAGIDITLGDPITPAVVGAVLASREGGCKDVPRGATVIPLINKVDDETREADARGIAAAFYEHLDDEHLDDEHLDDEHLDDEHLDDELQEDEVSVPHVVLGRMIDAEVVDTV